MTLLEEILGNLSEYDKRIEVCPKVFYELINNSTILESKIIRTCMANGSFIKNASLRLKVFEDDSIRYRIVEDNGWLKIFRKSVDKSD